MAPVMCEHQRLWTTCPACGKEAIKAARRRKTTARGAAREEWEENKSTIPARPETAESSPKEPEPTPFERH